MADELKLRVGLDTSGLEKAAGGASSALQRLVASIRGLGRTPDVAGGATKALADLEKQSSSAGASGQLSVAGMARSFLLMQAAVAAVRFSVQAIGQAFLEIDSGRVLERQLDLYTRSASAAKEWHSSIRAMAAQTGVAKGQIAAWETDLAELGYTRDSIMSVVDAMADMNAMGRNGSSLLGIARQVEEMQKLGRAAVSGRQIADMFKGTGLNQERIEKAMGISSTNRFDANRKLDTTSYRVTDIMPRIMTAISQMTGAPLGQYSRETAGSTLEAKLNAAREQLIDSLSKISFNPLTDAIQKFTFWIARPETIGAIEKFAMQIGDAGRYVYRVLSDETLWDGFESFGRGLTWIANAVQTVGNTIMAVGKAIGSALEFLGVGSA